MADPYTLGVVGEAREEGRLLRAWEAHGRPCAIAQSPMRGCNGYVFVPLEDRVDFVTVPAPSGLTWRDEAWVGFDTGHAWDVWMDPDVPESPGERRWREVGLDMTNLAGPDCIVWTIEKMVTAVEDLAFVLNALVVESRG